MLEAWDFRRWATSRTYLKEYQRPLILHVSNNPEKSDTQQARQNVSVLLLLRLLLPLFEYRLYKEKDNILSFFWTILQVLPVLFTGPWMLLILRVTELKIRFNSIQWVHL